MCIFLRVPHAALILFFSKIGAMRYTQGCVRVFTYYS